MTKQISTRLAALVPVVLLFGCVELDDSAPPLGEQQQAALATHEECYLASDSTNQLIIVDKTDFNVATNETTIGSFDAYSVEALAFDPNTNTLYAADADQLGTVNVDTGAFTETSSEFGTGTGDVGSIDFDDVDGLAFDFNTGDLFGSVRRNSSADLLIQIDPSTGAHIDGAFDGGDDYVVIDPVSGRNDIDDLAIDPIDGQMFGTANNGGSDHLVLIDPATGDTTDVGQIQTGAGQAITNVETLSFDASGALWAIGESADALFEIDQATATASNPRSLDNGDDYEGMACLTVSSSDLNINVAVSDPRPNETEIITVTVTLVNDGPHNAPAISASIPLPAGVTYQSDTPSDGTYTSGDGSWVVGPLDSGATATLTITIRVSESTAGTTITVTATATSDERSADPDDSDNTDDDSFTVNRPPVATDDNVSTLEDILINVSVLTNDSDDDGDTLSIGGVTTPSHGTAVIAGDAVTYSPTDNYHGADSFDYTVNDGFGGSDTGTVNITVTSGNDPPEAVDDDVSVNEDTPIDIDVLANDTDPDEDSLTVVGAGTPGHGTVSINPDHTLHYQPFEDYNGPDTFTYVVSDGHDGFDTATVFVTVGTVGDGPNAQDDSAETTEDEAVTIDVLLNDTDGDGDTLEVDSVTAPSQGSATINGDDTVTYTPTEDTNGVDTFTYTITDNNGGFDTATVTVTVTAVNDDPVAVDDVAGTLSDTPVLIDVLSNDSDVDGDTLIVDSVTSPEHGTATIDDSGEVLYTPGTGYLGVDAFMYVASDQAGGVATAAVTVTVSGDSDGDGLSDAEEEIIGTDPDDADSDDDGVPDGDEPDYDEDTDGDDLINALDPDSDDDGILDGTEMGIVEPNPDTDLEQDNFVPDEDPSDTTDPLDPDTDDGGVSDGVEDANHNGAIDDDETDPNNGADDIEPMPEDDADNDGILDADDNCPYTPNTDQTDTDGDGIGDACEGIPPIGEPTDDLIGDGIGVRGSGCLDGGCSATGPTNRPSLIWLMMLGLCLTWRWRRAR